MLSKSEGNLKTKVTKEKDGFTVELYLKFDLSDQELNKLKTFRENFGKSSPIHFHFNGADYLFSQTKYFKVQQFLANPVKIEEIENDFIEDVNGTLSMFQNYLTFEVMNNQEYEKTIQLNFD